MDVSANTATPAPARHDGWTGERKARFLDHLSDGGNVRASCRRVGMWAQAAYRLKRRDPLFARGWAAALALGRDASEQVLADRAIDGIEEEVWHRGELVGTRLRFDTRLLLAHLGRLDRLVDERAIRRDARRFDELLARIAGEELPEDLAQGTGDVLPLERREAAEQARQQATDALFGEIEWIDEEQPEGEEGLEEPEGEKAEDENTLSPEEIAVMVKAEAQRGRAEGEASWDAWFARACEAVDRATGWPHSPPAAGLPGSPLPPPAAPSPNAGEGGEAGPAFSPPCTVSLVSTSALARAMAGPRPFAPAG